MTYNQIKRELESLGYETGLFNSQYGDVITFSYIVETGSHKGKRFMLGISMQGSEPYPEYPPHWVMYPPRLTTGKVA